jgi:hypothetical protein
MKRFQRLGFIFLLLILGACSDSATRGDLYPWQVKAMSNGHSQVFGIELGKATLADAVEIMGKRYDAAVFENQDGSLSLELFYKEITLGGLTAKFVLTLDASDQELQRLKGRPLKKETLESGVIKYTTAMNDNDELEAMKITAITYMPITNLSEEIVTNRFGEPAEKIKTHESAQHWLYPEKGLDVLINAEGKEVLQFVPPIQFDKLVEPLRR